MRLGRLALLLTFAAGRAWAQAPADPAEAGSGSGTGSGSAEEKPVEPPKPSPTPEVGKEQVKQPPAAESEVPAMVDRDSSPSDCGCIDLDDYHARDRGFRFGSYGRVLAGSDLHGGKPQKIAVVAHAPRIVEDSYLELEFSYGFERRAGSGGSNSYVIVRPIITLAFAGTLFHDTGKFDAQPALRNMFLDGQIGRDLTLWVGSRMYRGDDIYLFDYWPLDDINTVGGGAIYAPDIYRSPGQLQPDKLQLAAHIGFNRLLDPFQFQQVEVANPVQGATIVDQLNRQRTIASASAAYIKMPSEPGGIGAKLKVHGEVHALPAGTRKRTDATMTTDELLPADHGFLIGAEAGVFGFSDNKRFRRHLNVFTRYAKGLAAFDELAPPTTFGSDLKTTRANEFTFGVSGNWDHKLGNMMIGALSRRFIDADTDTVDADDGWEYAVDARPLVRVVPDWFVGGDVSYQARFPKGLNNITLKAEDPAVFEIAPMVVWSPMGPSSYDRPQLRFVYRAAYLNQAALDLYVPGDPRRTRSLQQFIGFQAEWWFNSSTYR